MNKRKDLSFRHSAFFSQNGYRERVLIKADAESGQKVLSDAELLSERSEKQVRRRASTTRPTHSTDKAQKAAGKTFNLPRVF
jgi:hypothetical protein